jgi:hypothetical protein
VNSGNKRGRTTKLTTAPFFCFPRSAGSAYSAHILPTLALSSPGSSGDNAEVIAIPPKQNIRTGITSKAPYAGQKTHIVIGVQATLVGRSDLMRCPALNAIAREKPGQTNVLPRAQ